MNAQTRAAFIKLQRDAQNAGFSLALVSSFRSFERQSLIWNAKARGERSVLDDKGNALDIGKLSGDEVLAAIMRWSAAPGLSRHHWGTDIDVYDANAMALEDVDLVPEEVCAGGPCGPLHEWLDEQIENNTSYGFYRPYADDIGGVAPERWHLSFQPEAQRMAQMLTKDAVIKLWDAHDVALVQHLLARLDEIWPVFVDLPLTGQPQWVSSNL